MYFIYQRCAGESFGSLLKPFHGATVLNDAFVCRFVKRIFGVKTSILDVDFILSS